MKERGERPTPHEAIRRHVEGAEDWEWRETATVLYQWSDRFNDRFFGQHMPDMVLGFQPIDHRILAAYTLRRNPQGLLYEITFNTKHLGRPLWQTLETLMHEYVHLWQQNFGEHPVTRNYHNVEFVAKCEEIGLFPAIGSGAHRRPAEGAFAEFLRAYSVPEPPPITAPKLTPKGKHLDWWADRRERPRGRSTLAKWSCGCQNVRVGTKAFEACCLRCGNAFRRVDPSPESVGPAARTDKTNGWRQGRLEWPGESTPLFLDDHPSPTAEEDLGR